MVRILFVARPFINAANGTGDQTVAREIAFAIKHKYPNMLLDSERQVVIPAYHHLLSVPFYDYFVPLIFAVKSWFKPYDAVIFNTAYQTGLIRLFRTRKTFTVIFGFLFLHNKQKSLFDRYSYFLYAIAMRYSTVIIASTPENRQKVLDNYHVDAKLIALGVSDELGSEEMVQSKPSGKVVGYIGAYNARKRTKYLLDLVASPEASGITILLAGKLSVEFKDKLDALLATTLARVEVLDELDEKQKLEFYRRINFLYFPTSWEGFGLPIAEALKAGALPITHRDAVLPSFLRIKCIEVDDADEAIAVIERVKSSARNYHQMIVENYKYAEKMFSWDNYADFLVKDL